MLSHPSCSALNSDMVQPSRRDRCGLSLKVLLLLGVLACAAAGSVSAYVGNSFLQIPGVAGHWPEKDFQGWIRAETMSWPKVRLRVFSPVIDFSDTEKPNAGFAAQRMTFGGPAGAPEGAANTLVISMSKNSPDVPGLVKLCEKKTPIAEMIFAEDSEKSRPVLEVGPRPDDVPEYWRYKFMNTRITRCPVVAEATDRAFVFEFDNIEWLNWDDRTYVKIEPVAEAYPDVDPAPTAEQSKTKAFVIHWFGVAGDVGEDKCPVMNTRPSEDDYYALMSAQEAAVERQKNGEKGVDYSRQMGFRGPDRLSVVDHPGIVEDPGFEEPVSRIAYGVNLDGDDGSGKAPAGICKHKNYTSVDGKLSGVDNQLYTVVGCYSGFRGKNGYRNQTSNARRSDGNIVTLIEISGIDDEVNDAEVTVKIIHSLDKPLKDASGKTYLAYSSFRPTNEPQFRYYNREFKGYIEDGVIVTEPQDEFALNTGLQDPLLKLRQAQLRLTILADENLHGVLAGYMDWRRFMTFNRSSYSENLFGFQAPGLYNALKRNADGLWNPLTEECDGISTVYEIDAVPAFITAR